MHKLTKVFPTLDYKIIAIFSNEKKKIFDVKLLMDKYPPFKALEDIYLFFSVRVGPGGYAAIWNDELDISAESLYYEGKKYDPQAENKKVQKTISAWLKHLRKQEKVSQKQLSELSGIPQPAIARIETGKSDPQITTLNRLITPLGYQIKIEKILK